MCKITKFEMFIRKDFGKIFLLTEGFYIVLFNTFQPNISCTIDAQTLL